MSEYDEIIHIPISNVNDVILARRRGLELALSLGFALPDATKIAVAISELGRNIVLYTDGGHVTFIIYAQGRKGIEIIAEDKGPGIENVESVLAGGYTTSRGLGLGVSGSKKIMDEFTIDTVLGKGTKICAKKWL